ncbi:MAG: hypothetical protein FJY29_02130 [Betaproteobacteria bacterium]|nr:hypothetical protein [Betaproteobacteria bacterium]
MRFSTRILPLALAFFGTSSCKNATLSAQALQQGQVSRPEAHEILNIFEMREDIRFWAPRCGVSASKQNCDIGDATLFNGLLCLSGEELSCEAVRRSQGSDGRMWRAEFRVASDAVNSFSRDMAMGVLAYLVATRDVELARRWMSWIEANGQRLCRESSDNRCEFTPGFWLLFREVWEYLGLPLNQPMRTAVVSDTLMALLQSQFSPPGFELHLAGVNYLVRRGMKQTGATLDSLALALVSRQPDNPFFAYLHEGATGRVIRQTLQWCPRTAPAMRVEWSFERNQQDNPWERSMGWECIMLTNFLIRDLKADILNR